MTVVIPTCYPGDEPDAKANNDDPHQRHEENAAPVHSVTIPIPSHDVALSSVLSTSMLNMNDAEIPTIDREK